MLQSNPLVAEARWRCQTSRALGRQWPSRRRVLPGALFPSAPIAFEPATARAVARTNYPLPSRAGSCNANEPLWVAHVPVHRRWVPPLCDLDSSAVYGIGHAMCTNAGRARCLIRSATGKPSRLQQRIRQSPKRFSGVLAFSPHSAAAQRPHSRRHALEEDATWTCAERTHALEEDATWTCSERTLDLLDLVCTLVAREGYDPGILRSHADDSLSIVRCARTPKTDRAQ